MEIKYALFRSDSVISGAALYDELEARGDISCDCSNPNILVGVYDSCPEAISVAKRRIDPSDIKWDAETKRLSVPRFLVFVRTIKDGGSYTDSDPEVTQIYLDPVDIVAHVEWLLDGGDPVEGFDVEVYEI